MSRVLLGLIGLVLIAGAQSAVRAQSSGAPVAANASPAVPAARSARVDAGAIEGRVFSARAGTYLHNARVTVEGTSIETFTSDTGTFLLPRVPAGIVRVRVRYSGEEDLVRQVPVTPGQTATADFAFAATDSNAEGKTVKLDTFVVETSRYRNAQEIATNEERAAVNIKSVIAVDSIGYVSDGNIGDFVKFLPGVDVSNSGPNPDDASAVAVRGFGADSTAVLVDGVPIASGSPDALTRTVQLDSVSINNLSRLEVVKVATPDMSQDSPGGAINLVTRGAFELAKPRYDVSVAFNGNTNAPYLLRKTPGPYEPSFKTLPSVRLSATVPITKKIGISVSVASDNKYSLTRSTNMRDWQYTNVNTTASGVAAPVANARGGIRIDNPVVNRYETNEYQWLEYRQSGNIRLDLRPYPGLEIRANGQLSLMQNTGVTRRTQWQYKNEVGVQDWGDTYVRGFQRTATFNPSDAASMTVDARDRKGFTTQGYLTLKYRRNLWSVDANATASESFNGAPDRANGHFSTVDGTITPGRMDFTNINRGVVGAIQLWNASGAPIDYGRLSTWDPILVNGFRARSSEAYNRDLMKLYKVDLGRELDFTRVPISLKIGGQQREKSNHRWGAGATYEMRYVGPAIANGEIESPFASSPGLGFAGPQYWADPHKIYQLYTQHPDYFDDQYVSATGNVNSKAANYLSRVGTAKGMTETTTDWYGMATARFFHNRLTLVTGARQSRVHRVGYNVFNDPQYPFVKNQDGTLYRDSVYPNGVRFDGAANPNGKPRDAVLTDAALRQRMQAAGVPYLPDQLQLAPDGIASGSSANNLFLAQRARTTRYVNSSLTQPATPQVQLAYDLTQNLKAQVAWSRETRLPDLEGSPTTLLVQGASFQVAQNVNPTADPGGDGSITLSNVKGQPEINNSYNFKLGWYPSNGKGRYTISYYYKTVNKSWQTVSVFNSDSNYEALLESMGLSADEYPNYRIDTVEPSGMKAVRKGYEIEASQNLGVVRPWLGGWDVYLTYTRRPVTASSGGSSRLGWIPLVPVRAKWTGGVSFSTRRFSVQGRWTFTESGITYSGSGNSVTMPDGTTKTVQLYNLNVIPPEINVQMNYYLNKRMTLFAVLNRVASRKTYGRISDAQTGFLPDYAQWRTMQNRGISWSLGVNATF